MAGSVAAFRPNDPLTRAELQDLVAGLTEESPKQVASPEAPVTMAQLDARLVRALGLDAEAAAFYQEAAAAGAIDDSIAQWGLGVALALTWISGLDYARLAPRLLRGDPSAAAGGGPTPDSTFSSTPASRQTLP